MATVINNPAETRTVEREVREVNSDSSAGWIVALVIVLLAVVVGAYLWSQQARAPATPADTNINLTVPSNQTTPPSSTNLNVQPTQDSGTLTPRDNVNSPAVQ